MTGRCNHFFPAPKWRWAQNGSVKQIAGYCPICDAFLFWGKKVAGQKGPKQVPLFK